ncbi:hypothetical protein QA802_00555 [Streptomyces sp. B21-105]|uniref:hypothetical protein n=1 Tax=Streptomyces sp. B21-105 TaxID=3039417 RepID=UPI002FEEF5FD
MSSTGEARLVAFGYSGVRAFAAGLTCAGPAAKARTRLCGPGREGPYAGRAAGAGPSFGAVAGAVDHTPAR